MPKGNKLIPELHFPNFDGEWRMKDLEQCLDYLQPTPYLVESTDYNDEYETPVLTAGKSFILGYTDEKEGIFKDKLPVIIFDDFTTASKYVDFPFKVKSSAMKILLAKDNADIKFVYESMQNLKFEVGVHKRHWISVFSQLQIPLPSTKEQHKIASCLSSLDELIESHNQKLELLKDHKKGLMQNFFPQEGEKVPKIRFEDFKGDWTVRSIEKNIDLISGIALKSNELSVDKSGTPILRGINVTEGQIRHSDEIDKFYLGSTSELEKYLIEKNDIVIGMDGSKVGKNVALISEQDAGAILIQRVARIKAINCDIDYLYQHLLSDSFRNYVDTVNTSSGIPHISAKQIRDFKIGFPPTIEEQQKIASCLSALDELIMAEGNKIEQLQQHKKGLLQGLFPKIEK